MNITSDSNFYVYIYTHVIYHGSFTMFDDDEVFVFQKKQQQQQQQQQQQHNAFNYRKIIKEKNIYKNSLLAERYISADNNRQLVEANAKLNEVNEKLNEANTKLNAANTKMKIIDNCLLNITTKLDEAEKKIILINTKPITKTDNKSTQTTTEVLLKVAQKGIIKKRSRSGRLIQSRVRLNL